jgi:translation initiation factor 3 subunit A
MAQLIQLDGTLKRAEDLIALGQFEKALGVLHEGIVSKRKGQPAVHEQVMIRLVELSVRLENMRLLKEALMVFRNFCQNNSPQSLHTVLEELRRKANEKVEEAVRNYPHHIDILDLDAEEQPESLLAASIHGGSAEGTQNITHSLKFLWETFNLSLDLLKLNGKMVALYKETASNALDFCSNFRRTSECKRLCDTLSQHLAGIRRLYSQGGQSSLSYIIDLTHEDTALILIRIRQKAIQTCMGLELWQEAFKAAEDMHSLMLNGRMSHAHRSRFFTFLRDIFLRSGHSLFHAYASHLVLEITRTYRDNFPREEELEMANEVILATLAVPTYALTEDIGSTKSDDETTHERNVRLAGMLESSVIPTREFLLSQLKTKNIVQAASAEVKELFYVLENEQSPLSLSEKTKALFAFVSTQPRLAVYLQSLQKLLVGRVLGQLSRCYQSIKIANFARLMHFGEFEAYEAYIIDFSLHSSLNVKIDYQNSALVFYDSAAVASLTYNLSKMTQALQQCLLLSQTEASVLKVKETRSEIFGRVSYQLDEEQRRMKEKQVVSERFIRDRQEEHGKRELELKNQAEVTRRLQEDEVEKKKLELAKQNKLDNIKAQRAAIIMDILKSVVQKIKDDGFKPKDLVINGRKVDDMSPDELMTVGEKELLGLHARLKEKVLKERKNTLKQEYLKLEYLERARREVLMPMLQAKWSESRDEEVSKLAAEHLRQYTQALEIKQQSTFVLPLKEAYMEREALRQKQLFTELTYKPWVEATLPKCKALVLDKAQKEYDDQVRRKAEEEERRKQQALEAEKTRKAEMDQKSARLTSKEDFKAIRTEPNRPQVEQERPKTTKFKNTKKAEDKKEPPREETKAAPKTVSEPKTTLRTERPEEETKRPSAFGAARTERQVDRPPSKFVNKGVQERLQASMTTGSPGADDKPRGIFRSDIKAAPAQPTAQPEAQPQRKKITSSKKAASTQDKPERKTSEPDAEGFITVKKS